MRGGVRKELRTPLFFVAPATFTRGGRHILLSCPPHFPGLRHRIPEAGPVWAQFVVGRAVSFCASFMQCGAFSERHRKGRSPFFASGKRASAFFYIYVCEQTGRRDGVFSACRTCGRNSFGSPRWSPRPPTSGCPDTSGWSSRYQFRNPFPDTIPGPF